MVGAAATFEGLLINGPKVVIFPKDVSLKDFPESPLGQTHGPLRIMITGLVQVNYMYLGLKGEFGGSVTVVATNSATGQAYSGKMPQGDVMWMPQPELSPEEQKEIDAYIDAKKNTLAFDRFTLDLIHDLNLPVSEATYTVYAVLGDYSSNSLTIETKIE
jgi:hypothetical protein